MEKLFAFFNITFFDAMEAVEDNRPGGCLCFILLPLIELGKIILLFLISMLSYDFIPGLRDLTLLSYDFIPDLNDFDDNIYIVGCILTCICYTLYFYARYYGSLLSIYNYDDSDEVRSAIWEVDLYCVIAPSVVLSLIYYWGVESMLKLSNQYMHMIDITFKALLFSLLPMLIIKLCIIPAHIRKIKENEENVEEYQYLLSLANEFSELAPGEGSEKLKEGVFELHSRIKKAQEIIKFKSANEAAIALVISMLALWAIRFI